MAYLVLVIAFIGVYQMLSDDYLFHFIIKVFPGEYLLRVEVQPLHGGTELRVVVVKQFFVVLGAELLVGAGDDEVEQIANWTACLQSLKVQDFDVHLAILE